VRRARALIALGLVLALHGCALTAVESRRPPARRVTGARFLLVSRAPAIEDRPVTDQAAELMAHALRDAIDVVEARGLLQESVAAGTIVWMGGLLDRLEQGGWPSAEEGQALRARHGISAVLALQVTAYDQVWGRYGKFTRVGVVVRLVDTATTETLVDQHRELEVDEMRGRAFRFGLERVVTELAETVDPRRGVSAVNAWRYWRR
jgi:hypothetical protein